MAALAGILAITAYGASAITVGWHGWERAPIPYVWRDVAVVYFLCALPLAAALAVITLRRASAMGLMTLAVALLALSAAVAVALQTGEASEPAVHGVVGAVLRPILALGAAFASLILLAALLPAFFRSGSAHDRDISALGAIVTGVVVLILVPSLYVSARCRSDAGRLIGLVEQSRYGDAHSLVQNILALDPTAKWEGRSLRAAADTIEEAIRELEGRVSAPLPADASAEECLNRARDLAVLSRTAEAMEILERVPAISSTPQAANLRGTIHETRGQWAHARNWYQQARLAWEPLPQSAERTSGLIQAITGIAYNERKLGRYREAAAAYHELLALAPTADTHFLLARFYEDTQQSAKAQYHARAAMTLAPDRYAQQGRMLIDKLVTTHFGCFGVFTAE
jgi:tetratricopeptide (TPR) repeat protein